MTEHATIPPQADHPLMFPDAPDWPKGFDPNFLLQGDKTAARSRLSLQDLGSMSKSATLRLQRYLADPFLRPLCELYCNGATDLVSALILKQAGYLECEDIPKPELGFNATFEVVRFTHIGRAYFEEFSDSDPDESPRTQSFSAFDALVAGVSSYLCIDRGAGIVLTRNLAEVCFDLHDGEVLSKAMSMMFYSPQLERPMRAEATEIDRLEVAEAWSNTFNMHRTDAQVVDLHIIAA